MIFCKELKKEFPTKALMFKSLKDNREMIMTFKKAAIKLSDWVAEQVAAKGTAVKEEEETNTEIQLGDFIYPVINTTNYLDSHGDVHIDGIWDVSVNDQKNKVYYIINHDLEIGKVIAYPEDVTPMVKQMNWTDLGRPFGGTTQALIFKVKLTEKGNADANKAIIGKAPLQNSIRMRYIRMKLCINSTADYYKEEYANWLQYVGFVANKEQVMEEGYFWAVLEAQIYKEGSAVLYGSNDVTPILLDMKNAQNPPDGSSAKITESPSADSSSKRKSLIIKHLM